MPTPMWQGRAVLGLLYGVEEVLYLLKLLSLRLVFKVKLFYFLFNCLNLLWIQGHLVGRNKLWLWPFHWRQSDLGHGSLHYRGLDLGDNVRLSILIHHVSNANGLVSFSIDHVEVLGSAQVDPRLFWVSWTFMFLNFWCWLQSLWHANSGLLKRPFLAQTRLKGLEWLKGWLEGALLPQDSLLLI